jgi:hypothetical protein
LKDKLHTLNLTTVYSAPITARTINFIPKLSVGIPFTSHPNQLFTQIIMGRGAEVVLADFQEINFLILWKKIKCDEVFNFEKDNQKSCAKFHSK